MRSVYFGISVWGKKFLDTFLNLALPSFLAPGNLPACSEIADVRFVIITRSKDVSVIRDHPSIELLSNYAKVQIEGVLTPDQFVGSRYDTLALSHKLIIAMCQNDGGILSILTPDCVIADGGLSFGLKKVLDQYSAVQVIGPRGLLNSIGPILRSPPFINDDKTVVAISDRELVSLLSSNPHPMTEWLFWDAKDFSQFPSTVYTRAGTDSLIARAFHLHPLFLDLAETTADLQNCGTADASLIALSKIQPEEIYITKRSSEICVIELSSTDHDPMGAIPGEIDDRSVYVVDWAREVATSEHVNQFMENQFFYRGLDDLDWDEAIATSDRDMAMVMTGLAALEEERKTDQPAPGLVDKLFQRLVFCLNHPRVVIKRSIAALARLLEKYFFGGMVDLFSRSLEYSKYLGLKIVLLESLLFLYRCLDFGYSRLPYSNKFQLIAPSISRGAHIMNDLQIEFEAKVIPERASRCGPLTTLLHRLIRKFNILFVVNMIPGMGHNTVELDYLLRMKRSGYIPDEARVVLLRPPSTLHNETLELFRRHFWFASKSRFLANITAPISARFKDVCLNVGLSRLRWQLRDDGSWSHPPDGASFLYQIDKQKNLSNWKAYFKVRRATQGQTPLKEGIGKSLALSDFIGNHSRYALVQIKDIVSNATAVPTAPDTYTPAIRYLIDNGYTVVMIGREKMPDEFHEIGVIDYAGSSIASYKHDLQLVADSDIVITAGSGVAVMPDCMDIPLVYANSWHIGMPLPSDYCIIVPTLLSSRLDDKFLPLSEQAQLYWDLDDHGPEVFPIEYYKPRNASSEEILEATKEALRLNPGQPLTPNQKRYFQDALPYDHKDLGSRVSDYFIEKHASLLKPLKDKE